jgi:uncharacterized membrane protein YphA (DoxX/SURF4 family)
MARGLAVLRIFFGIILFANGLAKLLSFSSFTIGPYSANLVNLPITRAILATDGGQRTQVPLVNGLVNDVIIPNWGFFQWVITAFELGVGALLILGLATRGAALLGLGQQLFLAAVYFSSNRWMFEQPHEYVPLLILAVVPAGRVWGLDALIARTRPRFARWPF